jgi:hypothetical protein
MFLGEVLRSRKQELLPWAQNTRKLTSGLIEVRNKPLGTVITEVSRAEMRDLLRKLRGIRLDSGQGATCVGLREDASADRLLKKRTESDLAPFSIPRQPRQQWNSLERSPKGCLRKSLNLCKAAPPQYHQSNRKPRRAAVEPVSGTLLTCPGLPGLPLSVTA